MARPTTCLKWPARGKLGEGHQRRALGCSQAPFLGEAALCWSGKKAVGEAIPQEFHADMPCAPPQSLARNYRCATLCATRRQLLANRKAHAAAI